MASVNKEIGIVKMATQADIIEGVVRIKSVKWVIPASALAADLCELTDGNGRTIWKDVCGTTGGYAKKEDIDKTVNGVILSDLDRGEVYVYLEEANQ